MLASRLLLAAAVSAILSGCADKSIFPTQPPASFSDYPVTGALGSISVADLEAVAAAAKPNKIYSVGIANHDAVSVQITPLRHGSQTSLEFRRIHGRWHMINQWFVISWLQWSKEATPTAGANR